MSAGPVQRSRDVRVGDEWAVRINGYIAHGIVMLEGFHRKYPRVHAEHTGPGIVAFDNNDSSGVFMPANSTGRYVAMLVERESGTVLPYFVSKTAITRPWLEERAEREEKQAKKVAHQREEQRLETLHNAVRDAIGRAFGFELPEYGSKNGVHVHKYGRQFVFDINASVRLAELLSASREAEFIALRTERDAAVQRAESAEERLRAIKFMLDK